MTVTEELIDQAQKGAQDAAERLVNENSGLIWSVARRFAGRGTDLEDLYQLGCLGFLKAIQGFDPAFGTQFSTYAVPKIAGEIRRFLRDDGAVKVSRGIKERAYTIQCAYRQLVTQLSREPTVNEVSEVTGFTPEEIAVAQSATAYVESIQQESGDEGFSLENVLSDTESEEKMLEKIALRQGIERLPQREKAVICMRYFHGLTQERVSKVLGVSQVQVSRIEKKAIAALKDYIL